MSSKNSTSNAPANRSPIPSSSTAATCSTARKWNASAGFTKASEDDGEPECWSIGVMEQNLNPSIHQSINPPPRPIEVSAALIFRHGKLLITRRHAEAHLGGLWEFPGGKCELNETFEQCLIREIREELGVAIAVGKLFES